MSSAGNTRTTLLIIVMFLQILTMAGIYMIYSGGTNVNTAVTNTSTSLAETQATPNAANTDNAKSIPLTVTIISDEKCGATCNTSELVSQLKLIPSVGSGTLVELDYSDNTAVELLASAGLTKLPVALFSHNLVGNADLAQYLSKTANGTYSLELGASYDPTEKRSEKGFKIIEDDKLSEATKDAHYKGAADGKIVWIEYTDVNCHYCKKMEQDGTAKTVLEKFPNDLKKTTSNFIGVGGQQSQVAAETLECIAKVGGADAYNTVLSTALSTDKTSKDDIIGHAKEAGFDTTAVESCFGAGEMKDMVAQKFNAGKNIFGITGTPGNVVVNTETGEYEIISGAYPASEFERVIGEMLK